MADRNARRRKPRRRSVLIDVANGLLGIVVLGVLAAGAVFFFGMNRFYADGPLQADTSFVVERNSGLGVVSSRLEEQGLVENRFIFQAGGYALKKQSDIKAGEFNIAAGASMADILREITEGRPIQYNVTIPEGFTSWQVIDRLNDDNLLVGEITSLPAEGSILPDTYSYDRGDTRADVLARMQEALSDGLDEVWSACAPDVCGATGPIKTREDLVTLASIVEKETGVAGERPEVASVFINRLRRGMRLQSDPTIIYGITKGTAALGRGLRRSEIEKATPYNTYQIDGLPVGPIANPGIDALRAVANPADTDYLYFVAKGSVPSDGHVFATSYADHQKNVAEWRRIEREMARAAEEAEAEAARAAMEAAEAAEAGEDVPQ